MYFATKRTSRAFPERPQSAYTHRQVELTGSCGIGGFCLLPIQGFT